MQHLNIGQAATAAGVTPKMVRHYESLGLIPEADRTEAGYRLYGEREVRMLRFIRQCRTLGFSIEQIQRLLQLWTDDGRRSRDVKELARRQLEELEQRRRELDQMHATLSELVGRCAGDAAPHCPILEQLAQRAAQNPLHPAPSRIPTLKQVAPGTRRAAASRTRERTATQAPHPAQALMAWSHAAVAA
ncbi:MAG TPA: MerR family DNA-binding protein [Ramlibacter sp.]|nr:MerR family DNA-binding protein [Ramlibacter sp.]